MYNICKYIMHKPLLCITYKTCNSGLCIVYVQNQVISILHQYFTVCDALELFTWFESHY